QRLTLGLPLPDGPAKLTNQSRDLGAGFNSTPSELEVENIRLEEDVLVLGHGKQVTVGNVRGGEMHGDISLLEKNRSTVHIIGWAVNLIANKPADRIMVFSAGKLVAVGEPRLDFAEVARVFNSRSLLRSGFDLA